MPDRRRHRGAHPRDRELFSAAAFETLASAVRDYAWLITRGYAAVASLKLVGDRYALVERQRAAVTRVACSDAARARRLATQSRHDALAERTLAIDGFNVIISLEAALGGGFGLLGLDGARRDLASVHGTYRRVLETPSAIDLSLAALVCCAPGGVTWYLDRPVSNSGKLAGVIRERCAAHGLGWTVELVDHVDREVSRPGVIALSADGGVLDSAESWFDLGGWVVQHQIPGAWTLDFSQLEAR
ncbi:MAG TPA: DUF434 domain-containing protein [Polyangiaceae bacterium]|nr:DUF434 domain-containing protein [Polyangiaceae bacterium]